MLIVRNVMVNPDVFSQDVTLLPLVNMEKQKTLVAGEVPVHPVVLAIAAVVIIRKYRICETYNNRLEPSVLYYINEC